MSTLAVFDKNRKPLINQPINQSINQAINKSNIQSIIVMGQVIVWGCLRVGWG